MIKSEIRKEYKTKRSYLSKEEITLQSNKISDYLLSNFNFENKVVHIFQAISKFNEVNITKLIEHLFTINATVATSITHFSPLELKHCIVNSNTIYLDDQFGIPTPQTDKLIEEKEIDFVIIPLLAFDKKGFRVGYGKGLYDRFLSKCKPNCIKIGVSFFPVMDNISDASIYDIALDFCVTPDKIYKFNGV